ncbi:MAG: hypothetical protein H6742_22200 [Alphaproteobacteria bacterium]|nr:hypothetical protein [Alphaproteobacteria bacterium]
MFAFIHRARILWAMISLIRNPVDNLEKVLMVVDNLDATDRQDRILAGLPDTDVTRRALAEQPRMLPLDRPALRALPEGSLGRAYVDFLDLHGFDPADIPTHDAAGGRVLPGEWAIDHLRETHDLWHVLTGFDIDTCGEGGLQAFYLAQVPSPLPLILMGGILLNAMKEPPEEAARRMDALTRGWSMGKAARSIFGIVWRERWAEPLVDVQRSLGIVPLAVDERAAA